MAGTTAEDIRKHVMVYYKVFAALAVLTVLTVAVSYLDLGIAAAIVIAMLVATVKGSLVACYFMHLLSERGMLFWILGLCAVFFVVLMTLPALITADNVGAR